MPAWVLGVALIRSRLVPVVDLDALAGGAARPPAGRLVVARHGAGEVAILAQQTRGLVPLQSRPRAPSSPPEPVVAGEGSWQGDTVLVVDVPALVAAVGNAS
jgi:chemotaxis signal transduction protein